MPVVCSFMLKKLTCFASSASSGTALMLMNPLRNTTNTRRAPQRSAKTQYHYIA